MTQSICVKCYLRPTVLSVLRMVGPHIHSYFDADGAPRLDLTPEQEGNEGDYHYRLEADSFASLIRMLELLGPRVPLYMGRGIMAKGLTHDELEAQWGRVQVIDIFTSRSLEEIREAAKQVGGINRVESAFNHYNKD